MYRWTDPNDPDGAPGRPEQPLREEPAWLTDRPEPRSAYLFGDDPDRPADEWHRDQPTPRWQAEPTATWRAEPAEPAGPRQGVPAEPARPRQDGNARPAEPWQGERWHDETDERWHGEAGERWHADTDRRPGGPYASPVVDRTPAGRPTDAPTAALGLGARGDSPTAAFDLAAHGDSPAATAPAEGRHRIPRRLSRPALIGGAAAAATLVVSLGVGAVALGGDGPETDPAAADDTVAAAPALPGTGGTPGDALAAPTPSAAPTSAKPTPSPTRTTSPTPAPSRSTAASRRSVERSSAPATKAPVSSGVSAQAREVVNLVNAERAKAGCGALSVDSKLMTAAQRHSQDQADHRNMSHTGSDGSDAGDRLDRVGYAWRTYGENVAWNQKTPAAVMDAWMNSPGHRANILNCAFTEIGVGVASSNGPYWTQVFAAPR
ncbi:CAP domain-containing protein [Micromonospora sp. NPDC004336]